MRELSSLIFVLPSSGRVGRLPATPHKGAFRLKLSCVAVPNSLPLLCAATRRKVWRFDAMPLLRRAPRSSALPCLCNAMRCHARLRYAFAKLGNAMPSLCYVWRRYRCIAKPLPIPALPCFTTPLLRLAMHGQAMQCLRISRVSDQLAFSITLPSSSSSSHKKRPCPLLRHCPMPRSSP